MKGLYRPMVLTMDRIEEGKSVIAASICKRLAGLTLQIHLSRSDTRTRHSSSRNGFTSIVLSIRSNSKCGPCALSQAVGEEISVYSETISVVQAFAKVHNIPITQRSFF